MPRPADAAVAVSQMMIALAKLIHQNEPFHERNLGASLEKMFVAMAAVAATGEGRPLTATEIAERMSIPRSNVVRHLKDLTDANRVSPVHADAGVAYTANLEQLDGIVTTERFEETQKIVSEAARTIGRLRGMFDQPA